MKFGGTLSWVFFIILCINFEAKAQSLRNIFFLFLQSSTWNLGCNPGGDGRPKALDCAGFDGEGIGGAWVKPHKEVVGLIPELEDFPSLAGQVSTGIQRPNGLVGDLQRENKDRRVRRALLHLAVSAPLFCHLLRLNKHKVRDYFRIISVSPTSHFVFGCCQINMTIFSKASLGEKLISSLC